MDAFDTPKNTTRRDIAFFKCYFLLHHTVENISNYDAGGSFSRAELCFIPVSKLKTGDLDFLKKHTAEGKYAEDEQFSIDNSLVGLQSHVSSKI